MQHDFWHQRWQQNQIGFHSQDVNSHLKTFWPHLKVGNGQRVLVPLCGKSQDLLWLLAQGHSVVGIELSPLAVEAFFNENRLQPTIRKHGDFWINEIDGLQIFCGDFFSLHSQDLGKIDAVYDRASLVALPPEMRIDYASHMGSLLESGTQTLLVAFDYPQHEMLGPPFSVNQSEIELLYRSWCEIEFLAGEDALSREAHFQQRGLTQLSEQVYKLKVI